MEVSEMASRAGISRDKAHRVLREAGVMSWQERREWAKEVLSYIPRGGHEQNVFRSLVNMNLLKALGSRPEDIPQSVEGVLKLATQGMKDNGHPSFEPAYTDEKALLALSWPR
jgi:hypothetical protein